MKKILFTSFCFLFNLNLFGQVEIADALYENFEYNLAIQYYNNDDSLDTESKVKLAISYFRVHDFENSGKIFEELFKEVDFLVTSASFNSTTSSLEGIDPILNYYYAVTLKNNRKYDIAKTYFKKYNSYDSTHYYTLLHLRSLDSLIIWDTLPEEAEIAEIKSINSSLADYSPRFYQNGILICSELKYDSLKKRKSIDFLDYYDDFETEEEKKILTEKIKNELDYGANLSPRTSIFYIPLNEDIGLFQKEALYEIPEGALGTPNIIAENKNFNIGSFDFNPVTNELFFTKTPVYNRWQPDISKHSLLYKATIDRSTHSLKKRRMVKIRQASKTYGIGEPAISSDGNTIYFISDKPKGQGGTDIYSIKKNEKGKWGKATNLGPQINTAGNENSPFIYDDQKLYFSTDGRPGYGGLDIFVADILDNDSLGTPKMLTSPINSPSDDFGITIHPLNESLGIISSNRAEGVGDDDLYFIHFTNLPPYVKGLVLSEDGNVQGDAIIRLINDNNEEIEQLKTTADGKYRFDLDKDKSYELIASIEGFAAELSITTDADWAGNERQDLILQPATTVQGYVYDEDGNPVPNAKMELFDENDNLVLVIYTDDKGYYQFVVDDEEEYLVMGSKYNKKGDRAINTGPEYISDSISNITIFNPSAFVEGIVYDENGNPIEGAIVRLFDSSNVEISRVTSDTNGRYHFDMSSNHNYRVIATNEGLVDDILIDTGKGWEGNEKKDLFLKPHPTAQGNTLHEKGDLIGDVEIKLFDDDNNLLLTIFSNETGYYQIPLLSDPTNKLTGEKNNLSGEIIVINDSNYNTHSVNNILLSDPLDALTSVKGIVRDEDGIPIPGARVDLYDDKGNLIASAGADETGKYYFDIEKNNNYQLVGVIEGFEGLENIYTGDKWDNNKLVDITLFPSGDISEGLVTDSKSQQAIEGVKVVLFDKKTEKKVITFTDASGLFKIKLSPENSYNLKLEIDGYYPKTIELPTGEDIPEKIDLNKLKIDSAGYTVKSIYFDYDKYDITADSKKQLDLLIKKLTDDRSLKIEIRSYADCRGSKNYNINLSSNRSKAIKKYLLSHGTLDQQIKTKALGATNFVNNCYQADLCTEKEHGLNRRSEFEFIKSK